MIIEKEKRITVAVLAVLCAIFLIAMLSMSARRQSEQAKRINLEQGINNLKVEKEKLNQQNEALRENLKEVISKLEEEKNLSQRLKGALAEEQLISQSLRTELEKVVKEKQELQEGIRRDNRKKK